MAEETITPPTTPPLPNTLEARTETGELKSQSNLTDGSTTPAPATAAEPATVPEKYDFKLPDNFKLDEKLLGEATPLFKEMGLPQAQAQKLVDWYAKQQQATAKAADESVTAMRAEWRDQVMKDPAIGPKLDTVRADIGKALTNVLGAEGLAEFKAAMDLTGAGDHPAFIRTMMKFAAAVNEGTPVLGAGPSPHGQIANGQANTRPAPAKSMYPNLP